MEDHLIWKSDSKSAFSIKSGWNVIRSQNYLVDWGKFVWQPKSPLKSTQMGENYLEIFLHLMLTSNRL